MKNFNVQTSSLRTRKIIATVFIALALVLGAVSFRAIDFPIGIEAYFQPAYYQQFGRLALCAELLVAGRYLYVRHAKANFALALFGFSVLLDAACNISTLATGSFTLILGMLLLSCAAGVALWLAFTNTFRLGRITFVGAVGSFILGTLFESFFDALYL